MNNFKNLLQRPIIKQLGSIFNIGYSVSKRLFYSFILCLVLLFTIGAGVGLGYFANIISKTPIPTAEQLKTNIGTLNHASTLHYGDGELISEVQSDLIRKIITTEEISDWVKKGIIATEDSSFYTHNGIMPKAVMRATLQELLGSNSQTGGSTLTQQLVKQQLLTSELTFTRKAKELLLAMRVEKFLSKDEILTAYLNVSPFGRNHTGQNIAGIQAAAEGVFGKNASDLTLPQAAFLVGLPQSPYVYTPYTNTASKKEDISAALARMHIVLDAMYRNQFISQQEWEDAKQYDIAKDFLEPSTASTTLQSYLYQAVHREAVIVLMKQAIKEDGRKWEDVNQSIELYNQYYANAANRLSSSGYRVYSTIDKNIYNAMQSATQSNLGLLGPTYKTPYTDQQTNEQKIATEPPQVGSVAIENQTGKIVGFIGGVDFSTAQTDHAFATRRSPGSTIKPLLVYAPAIEEKVIYPASILADTPIRRLQPDGTYWEPTNATGSVSNTFMSARQALKMSLNNPTIHLYSHLLQRGIPAGSYMEKMGITAIQQSEYANEAASVGGFSSGPTVLEQTSAFTTFANDGVHVDSYLIEKIEDRDGNIIYQHEPVKTQVFSEGTAYILRSMLADSVNGGTTQYFKKYLNFTFPETYGKTGTSDNYQDMWTIISTPKITIGQWSGWDNHYGVKHVFQENTGAGHVSDRTQRVWAYIANAINRVSPHYFDRSQRFSGQPASVMRTSVLESTGTLPGSFTDASGRTLQLNGNMVSDLFLTDRPPFNPSFNFSPGASDRDLSAFWARIFQPQNTRQEERKNEKDEENKENTETSSTSNREQSETQNTAETETESPE